MNTDLLCEPDAEVEGLTWITLNRPDARNAYSDAMITGLVERFDQLEVDPSVRVVAITGAGSAFSAGGDLKRMRDHDGMFEGDATNLAARYMRGIQSIPRRLHRFDKPVIAAVNGHAIGAGLDLTCMADFRVVARGAKLGSTFVKVGLVPGDGGATFLSRTIGFARAIDLVLTGRRIDADEALAMGLATEVCEREALTSVVRERARHLASLPPVALRLAKSAIYQSWDLTLEQSLRLASTLQGVAQNTADHDEAVLAFLEKRKPTFEGR